MKSAKTATLALAALMSAGTEAAAQDSLSAAKNTGAEKAEAQAVAVVSEAKADTLPLADFSRYMGMAQTMGLKNYLTARLNVDTTKMSDFSRGLEEMLKNPDNKSLAAYAAGVQIGQQLMQQILRNVNQRITDKDGGKYLDEEEYKKGILAGVKGEGLAISADSAAKLVQIQMEFYAKRNTERKYGANREKGEKFLAEIAAKEGVRTIPGSKVQYKILKEGTGEKPQAASKVKVNYEGKLIDGTVFDSSYKRNQPAVFECDRVINGWTQALTNMPVGSIWEIYIPQELGYGERGSGEKIPPYSALIFKVELLSIEK